VSFEVWERQALSWHCAYLGIRDEPCEVRGTPKRSGFDPTSIDRDPTDNDYGDIGDHGGPPLDLGGRSPSDDAGCDEFSDEGVHDNLSSEESLDDCDSVRCAATIPPDGPLHPRDNRHITGGDGCKTVEKTSNGDINSDEVTVEVESGEMTFGGEAESGEMTVDREAESGETIVGGEAESGEMTVDRETESGEMISGFTTESGEITFGGAAESGKMISGNASENSGITFGCLTESGGEMTFKCETDAGGLTLGREATATSRTTYAGETDCGERPDSDEKTDPATKPDRGDCLAEQSEAPRSPRATPCSSRARPDLSPGTQDLLDLLMFGSEDDEGEGDGIIGNACCTRASSCQPPEKRQRSDAM
jgi:hypothetical protein